MHPKKTYLMILRAALLKTILERKSFIFITFALDLSLYIANKFQNIVSQSAVAKNNLILGINFSIIMIIGFLVLFFLNVEKLTIDHD